MISMEKVLKEYHKQDGVKRIRDRKGDLTDRFLDLEFEHGITEEMLIGCIKGGYIKSRDDMFNVRWVKEAYELILSENAEINRGSSIFDHGWAEVNMSERKPEEVEVISDEDIKDIPMDGNPFQTFETMITGVVNQQAMPMVEKKIENRLNKWVSDHDRDIQKIQKDISWTCKERGGEVKGVVHELFETICTLVQGNEPVLLVGPAGTGKNFTAKQVADRFNLEFYFTNSVTQEYKLTGFIDANGRYHDTQFFRAFTGLKVGDDGSLEPIENGGGLFFFDEMDVSEPEILKLFNTSLENGYMDFPIGRFDAHENFRVIAAANTWGTGASFEYVGHQLDASTLDRFMPRWFDYDRGIEESLTDDLGLLDFIRTFRNACTDYGIHCVTSYRAIRRCEKFKNSFSYEDLLKMALLKNLEKDDLNMMVDRFNTKADAWSQAFMNIARG